MRLVIKEERRGEERRVGESWGELGRVGESWGDERMRDSPHLHMSPLVSNIFLVAIEDQEGLLVPSRGRSVREREVWRERGRGWRERWEG